MELSADFFLVTSKVFSTIQVLVSYKLLKLEKIRDKTLFHLHCNQIFVFGKF